MLRAKQGLARWSKLRLGPLLFAGLLVLIAGAFACHPVLGQKSGQDSRLKAEKLAQSAAPAVAGKTQPVVEPTVPAPAARKNGGGLGSSLAAWEGKPVLRIEFEGVAAGRLGPLPEQLAQQPNAPLRAENVRQSLRRLYATGLYDNISAEGSIGTNNSNEGNGSSGVVLIFRGEPRTFIGMVTVEGAKGANTNALLVRTSRLTPGTRFTSAGLDRAEAAMRHSLAANGFYEPVFTYNLTPHPADQLVDIAFEVVSGPQARTGEVAVSGDSGLTSGEFRRYSKLTQGKHIDHDTAGKALSGIESHYRKEERLEADVKLQSRNYTTASHSVDFNFAATRGPVVHVLVDGVSLSQPRIRKLLPIFQEGAVDEDLLNEGNRSLENYYQRFGYFDVKVSHEQKVSTANLVEIVFHVQLGARHRVGNVSITGFKYFDLPTLKERLSVRARDAFDRQGIYNQSLVAADVGSLQAIYQNNGFSKVKVTPEIQDQDGKAGIREQRPSRAKQVILNVVYQIDEGPQQRVHSVKLVGNAEIASAQLVAMLNTAAGQPLSPETLAGDRETLLTHYLSRGFDQAQVEVTETEQAKDAAQVDIVFHVQEGEQVFLRRVMITGLHHTRPETIAHGVTMKEGEPLDETALLNTQRNLYDLGLFNEVNPVIQNPTGQEPRKTVLLQTTEARRWDISYGGGFEVQTGTVNGSNNSNPNGTVGASPRGVLEISRINLFGRDQTVSLRGNLGLLEQRVNFVYQYPHILGDRNFSFTFSAGYNNSQDVITYSASKLEGSVRLTEKFSGEHELLSKANTFIYQFVYRRVKVDQNSVQIPSDDIPLLLEAVRVGGPSFTWIRDTRDAPLDAHRGTYTSFQEFISSAIFDSQANFNQVDASNSSYYELGHSHMVLARNTRYGQERAYGKPVDEAIPLPERLYGGGGNSHRGFGVNSAGPRDPQSGFPIGGAGVFVNSTELRMPPPTLPFVGNTVSFVLFHDMGNVFTNSSDIWPSALRFRQQNRAGCRDLTGGAPTGPVYSTGEIGTCTFNYFSHALGLGLRYRTPIGPVRVDFSWNLNPPIYPVTYDTVTDTNLAKPYVGEGSHFNFFFSLGQSF
jgi:outer membrane protein insertion porin family